MKNQLLDFWSNHKNEIIQIGGALIGAVVGVGITSLILAGQEDEIIEFEQDLEIGQ